MQHPSPKVEWSIFLAIASSRQLRLVIQAAPDANSVCIICQAYLEDHAGGDDFGEW